MRHRADEAGAIQRLLAHGLYAYVERVERRHGVHARAMLGPRRTRSIMAARTELYVLLAHTEGLAFAEIGRVLGRDHTTIMSAVHSYEERLAQGFATDRARAEAFRAERESRARFEAVGPPRPP